MFHQVCVCMYVYIHTYVVHTYLHTYSTDIYIYIRQWTKRWTKQHQDSETVRWLIHEFLRCCM